MTKSLGANEALRSKRLCHVSRIRKQRATLNDGVSREHLRYFGGENAIAIHRRPNETLGLLG